MRTSGVRIAWVMALAVASVSLGCGSKAQTPTSSGAAEHEVADPTVVASAELEEATATALATGMPSSKPEDPKKNDKQWGTPENQPSPTGDDRQRKAVIFQAFTSDDVEGKLHEEDVSKTLDDNAARLTSCLSTDAIVKIKLRVLPSGRVAEARVLEATPNDPKLRDCVVAVLRSLTFPRLKGSQPASLAMDLSLKKAPI